MIYLVDIYTVTHTDIQFHPETLPGWTSQNLRAIRIRSTLFRHSIAVAYIHNCTFYLIAFVLFYFYRSSFFPFFFVGGRGAFRIFLHRLSNSPLLFNTVDMDGRSASPTQYREQNGKVIKTLSSVLLVTGLAIQSPLPKKRIS